MHRSTLFLTLETFSQTGGIQKVCRALARAMEELPDTLTMYSLCDADSDLMDKYVSKDHFKGFRGRKLLFFFWAIAAGIKHKTTVLAHINLLPVACVLKFCFPSRRIVMLAHGIEVWRALTKHQRRFLNKHAEIWAVSEFTRKQLIRVNDIDPEKIIVLPNCLDPFFSVPTIRVKPASLVSRYHITVGQPILMTLCRLSAFEQKKGYDLVINCIPLLLKQQPTLKYMIVGPYDDFEKQRLDQLVYKLNLGKHVFIVGFVPEDELIEHFLLADVFIMPSQKEGFGLVLLEAAACGCKVIAGNRDGSGDALLGGKLGCLVDPESSDQILEALQAALRDTPIGDSSEIQRLALSSFGFSVYKNNVRTLLT
jgi:phosphatidylinositol alpha-1,6-mannosyltransferase